MSSLIISCESISSNRLLCQSKVQQTVSAERGVNVTMLAFVNAVGGTIPPVFVFPRKKKPNPQLSTDGPIGCLGLVHE